MTQTTSSAPISTLDVSTVLRQDELEELAPKMIPIQYHAVSVGELLVKAKAVVPDGEWIPWIEKNCELRPDDSLLALPAGIEELHFLSFRSNPATQRCNAPKTPTPNAPSHDLHAFTAWR